MIISHSKKFVMFLPWKTASQTILARLENFNESPYSRFFSFNSHLNRVVHQHLTCSDFNCLPEVNLGYFSASFVRNPYDKVYSGFRQLQKDIEQQPLMKFESPWVKELVLTQLTENTKMLAKANYNFDNWVELIDEYKIFEQGRNTNFPLHPAHYWTHIAGKKVVNFIGKVETFETDIRKFSQMIGVGNLPIINSNVLELDTLETLGTNQYRYVDRMNQASIKKINLLFKKDFELFSYNKI
jgi:hypothetical protein